MGLRYLETASATSARFRGLLSVWLFIPNYLFLQIIITLFEAQLLGSKDDETAGIDGIDRPKKFFGTCPYMFHDVGFLGGGM